MRIVAGEFRGRTLIAPRGAATRPTSDRVREAVFSIIGPLDRRLVLDLFAGSGALGLEALSRGAAAATFVDSSPGAIATIRVNCAIVPDSERVRIVQADWRSALRSEAAAGRKYGLCLVDPPYSVLPRIAGRLGPELAPVLGNGAILVVEYSAASGPVELDDLEVTARTDRTYGGTGIAVMRIGGRTTQ
jgi:16S rRNA (guanine966-N2)-methyltransferase